MKSNNVLQFPKEKALRISLRDRTMQQRGVLVLSIFSILAVTVMSNQWLTRVQESSGGGRGLASVPGAMGSASNVKWEHELARELSRDQSRKVHLAVRPTLKDELIYGSLEGRYGMTLANGRIEGLEFLNTQGGSDSPVTIQDRAAFLSRYRDAFSVEYASVALSTSASGEEVWNLVRDDKTIVGKAHFKLDESGRMVSFIVK